MAPNVRAPGAAGGVGETMSLLTTGEDDVEMASSSGFGAMLSASMSFSRLSVVGCCASMTMIDSTDLSE